MDNAGHCPGTYLLPRIQNGTHIKRCRKMDCLTLYDVVGRIELEMVVGSECARL